MQKPATCIESTQDSIVEQLIKLTLSTTALTPTNYGTGTVHMEIYKDVIHDPEEWDFL